MNINSLEFECQAILRVSYKTLMKAISYHVLKEYLFMPRSEFRLGIFWPTQRHTITFFCKAVTSRLSIVTTIPTTIIPAITFV